MHDEIHVVVDSISAADETFLKDDPRCHIVRLILRHGDHEWIGGESRDEGADSGDGGKNRQAADDLPAADWHDYRYVYRAC